MVEPAVEFSNFRFDQPVQFLDIIGRMILHVSFLPNYVDSTSVMIEPFLGFVGALFRGSAPEEIGRAKLRTDNSAVFPSQLVTASAPQYVKITLFMNVYDG